MADDTSVQRIEDFVSLYANNSHFEASVWDLRILFGQLDQSISPGKAVIEQHTAITVPWAQAKLMAYFITVNVAIHEAEHGSVFLPPRILPPKPDPSKPDLDQRSKNVSQYLAWVHEQYFGPNPYIPPGVDPDQL